MESSVWEIISAISSAVGAIATPITIAISLRPYRRRILLKGSCIRVLFNGEDDIIPSELSIVNLGEKQRVIRSWGVASSDKKQKYEIEGKELRLNENDEVKVNLLGTAAQKVIQEITTELFKFYVCDNRGKYYYSSTYYKTDFIQTGNLKRYFS